MVGSNAVQMGDAQAESGQIFFSLFFFFPEFQVEPELR